MRKTSRFEWWLAAVGLVALGTFHGGGCSDDTGESGEDTGGGGTATAGDTGGSSGGMTTGGGGDSDGVSEACRPRSKYLQIYQPNVYVLFDRSGSMGGRKMKEAKLGLDKVADQVADEIRFGISAYPIKSCCCSTEQLLELGEHTPEEIKMSYASLDSAGGTPTAAALSLVRKAERLTDADDDRDDKRTKALILVTDGEPNDDQVCPERAKDPVAQTEKLAEQGIQTYVVGYQSEADPATLNSLAKAGGTDAPGSNRFYEAADGEALASAMLDITGTSVSCSFRLQPTPPEGTGVNVTIGDEDVPENGYAFDDTTGKVQLEDDWCTKVRDQASQGIKLNIDVGCPGCSVPGESCESDGDCCGDATCDGGTCKEPCRSLGEECITDGECCSPVCEESGEGEFGTCQSG